jgi:RimJ/RimL family protein N-acetyltransferase
MSPSTEPPLDEDAGIRIEPWAAGDLPLLKQTMGAPELTVYLGGPENDEKLAERQVKYERLADSGEGRMFKIVDPETGESIGSVGYWDKEWLGESVYEIGWFVIKRAQGRGIATIATRLAIARARGEGKHRFIHAFPSVENPPSNAICRKLGFTLMGEHEFEFPKGHFMHCNDWRLDLSDLPD